MSITNFRTKLEHLINCESQENGSNTPDWILAEYLVGCLQTFDAAVVQRETWYGRPHSLIATPAMEAAPANDPGRPVPHHGSGP